MGKDPAVLFFIDKWFLATKEMKSDCRGWYLNLILHQYDKKDLPNDIEELANLADVRISEFERFKQVFEQVLKHKFKQNENGRLENEFASEILKGRELFKQKRSEAGKLSYFLRAAKKKHKIDAKFEKFLKENIDLDFDLKDEQVFEQVFKQMSELYINVNVDVNTDDYKNIVKYFMDFYFKKTGVKYPFSKVDGASVKTLLTQLRSIITEGNASDAFNVILSKYDNWGKWEQGQLKLNQISSNLANIINNIKNGNPTAKKGTGGISHLSEDFLRSIHDALHPSEVHPPDARD